MKYTVVVVTYNRLALLKECVSCILNQTHSADRVIIVDNASTDGTSDYLDMLDAETFVVLHQTENLGGSGGFRVGIEAACRTGSDYILIIDDDAMLESDYIRFCDEYLNSHSDCPACSGTVVTDGKIQLNHRRVISNHLIFAEKNVPLSDYKAGSFNYTLSTFCGLMVSRELAEKIGPVKSEYFIFYDDTEYSMRIAEYGPVVNVNRAILNHETAVTPDKLGFYERMNWKTYYGHRNRYDAARQHIGGLTTCMVWLEFSVFIIGALPIYLNPKTRDRGKYIIHMLRDARRDGRTGKLGKNQKYQRV